MRGSDLHITRSQTTSSVVDGETGPAAATPLQASILGRWVGKALRAAGHATLSAVLAATELVGPNVAALVAELLSPAVKALAQQSESERAARRAQEDRAQAARDQAKHVEENRVRQQQVSKDIES